MVSDAIVGALRARHADDLYHFYFLLYKFGQRLPDQIVGSASMAVLEDRHSLVQVPKRNRLVFTRVAKGDGK